MCIMFDICFAISITFAFKLGNSAFYNSDELAKYLEFNQLRSKFYDFTAQKFSDNSEL